MNQTKEAYMKGAVKKLFWSFCFLVFATFALVFYVPIRYLGIPVDPDFGVVHFSGAQVEYFDVFGDNGRALWQQVRQKGPNGGNADAVTEWNMAWQFEKVTTGDGTCSTRNPKVTYTIKVIFPRWADPQRAPYALLKGWQDYINGIARHEQHHVNIVLENAGQVEQAILQAGCGNAEDAAQKAYDEIVLLQEQYDRETDNGRLEGIVFPA